MQPSKRVIYTCVIGGYDVVFPPLNADPDVDYVILTDDPDLQVDGWQVRVVTPRDGLNASALNRYHKVFCHRIFPEYRSSIYVDGNLRPVASLKPYFEKLETMPCDLLVRPHALRNFVSEEIESCIRDKRVPSEAIIRDEYAALLADGFEDIGALTTNNILLRDHTAPALDAAMTLWWHYISTYSGRDQVSLPHVVRKTGLRQGHTPRLTLSPTKYFQPYAHLGTTRGLRRLEGYMKARSAESKLFRLGHKIALRLAR